MDQLEYKSTQSIILERLKDKSLGCVNTYRRRKYNKRTTVPRYQFPDKRILTKINITLNNRTTPQQLNTAESVYRLFNCS